MKRTDLMREMRSHAKTIGVEVVETEGGSHTKVVVGDRRSVVPRHKEINDLTVKSIRGQLGMSTPDADTKGKKARK